MDFVAWSIITVLVVFTTHPNSVDCGNNREYGRSGTGKKDEEGNNKKSTLMSKDIYKAVFQAKRAQQLDAVKRILAVPGYEKQYSLLKIVLKKIFDMLADSKVKVTQSGYIPGGDFPSKQEEQEALALVFENIAFFGDILLRTPTITHSIISAHRDWRVIVDWGVSLCGESGIFAGANQQLLNLVAQELELVPRDPNYVNPYKEQPLKGMKTESQQEKKTTKKRKKDKKKKSKGPRLSRSDL